MAKYTSEHAKFSFYINGVRRRFLNGTYVTTDEAEIARLDKIPEVKRIDEPTVVDESQPVVPEAEPEEKKPQQPRPNYRKK
jgi:hypothetical protein